MIDETTLQAFRNLFNGRTDRWGGITDKGGVSNPGPVTDQHYRDHLEGKTSFGCYPLLDNGTVNFFAVDLDWHDETKGKKDFNVALKIREEFHALGIPVYIANSKSLKGFHIYGFPATPVAAADVRKICLSILTKMDMKNTEIFPKQDQTDNTVKYGNYINLPYFGNSQRKFLTVDQQSLELAEALSKIKRADPTVISEQAHKLVTQHTIADIEKSLKQSAKGPKTPRAAKIPPCIANILKGVGQGMRDIAAFTLASHYLSDQNMTPDDTLIYLEKWNARNNPPLDVKDLEEKVKSADKGYDVGCNKIKNEPLLKDFCVGEQNCAYIQNINKEKIKNGQIQVASFYETDTHLYEEIIQNGKPIFAAFEKKTGLLTPVEKIDLMDGISVIPFTIEKDGELFSSKTVLPVVTLPTGVENYTSEEDLVEEIRSHIATYCDIPEDDVLFCTYYVLSTWIYDRLNTLCYLRFMGDIGSGKSTCLDVIGKLCYKPMMAAGAVTPAPIYRIIRKFGGTLILDESDMKFTDIENDITKILNCGVSRGRSVLRCVQEDQEKMIASPVYGPKVFSTRGQFTDKALESRCLTIITEVTDKELPIADGDSFLNHMQRLRNKLLVWRFRKFSIINGDDAININLDSPGTRLEPRLKQIARPFALTFKDNTEMMEKFRKWMLQRQKNLIDDKSESPQGHVVHSLFKLARELGRDYISTTAVRNALSEDYKLDVKVGTVGNYLKSLKIQRQDKRHSNGKVDKCVVWNPQIMKKLINYYFQSEDRLNYQDLLVPSVKLEPDPEYEEQQKLV